MGYQGNQKQRHRLLTPLLKPRKSFRDDQTVMENLARPDNAVESNSQQTGSHTAQFDSPQALAQTRSSEPCRCKKTSSESRDAETQTSGSPTAETCDASTQCSSVADGVNTWFNLRPPPVDVSVQQPATGRQTDTAAEPNTHTPPPGSRHTPWSQRKSRAASLSGSSAVNKFTASNSDGKVNLQRPMNPCLDALSMTDGRGIT